jgi:hypothetical protein
VISRSLIAIGLLLALTSSVHAQTLQHVNGFTVVDANGTVVGNAISLQAQMPIVALEVSGVTFTLVVLPDRLQSAGRSPTLWFESTDCSGAPMIEPGPFLSATVIGSPGDTLYAQDPNGVRRIFTAGSKITEANRTCQPTFGTLFGVPAIPLIDLSATFVPPFSLRAF